MTQFEKSLAKHVRPFACSPVRRKKRPESRMWILDERLKLCACSVLCLVLPNRPNGKGQFEKSLAKPVRPFPCSPVRRKKKARISDLDSR